MPITARPGLGGGFGAEHYVARGLTQIPDDPEPREHAQNVESNIYFPPEETLASRSHVVMMVVVPALTHGHQGQQSVVLAGISGGVASATEDMRERINRERTVPQNYRTDAIAPHEQAPATDKEHQNPERDRRNQVIFVQPAQLRILLEVVNQIHPRGDVAV